MNIGKLKKFITAKIIAEIPSTLSYHGLHHTLDVLRVCNDYIKRLSISKKDAYLLRTAALMHDLGILYDYKNHEEYGTKFVRKLLPSYDYSQSDIDIVCNMILATRIPQEPKTPLEQVICDADLDYLGTDSFYTTGDTLYKEFLAYKVVKNEEEWDKLQVSFLQNHSYQTDFAIRNRKPHKLLRIQEIKNKWGW